MKRIGIIILALALFTGCKKSSKSNPQTHKILILGNSITYAPADASFDWSGNWGMAATSADKDFVHVFSAYVKGINPNNDVVATNISAFERNFDTYNIDKNLKTYKDFNPDIVILRIGENITRNKEEALFDQRYKVLLDYFKSDNPSLKVLAVGAVWPQYEMVTRTMKKYSNFVPLIFMQNDRSNFAYGQFSNPDVASHPSDKGMVVIANTIFSALKADLQK